MGGPVGDLGAAGRLEGVQQRHLRPREPREDVGPPRREARSRPSAGAALRKVLGLVGITNACLNRKTREMCVLQEEARPFIWAFCLGGVENLWASLAPWAPGVINYPFKGMTASLYGCTPTCNWKLGLKAGPWRETELKGDLATKSVHMDVWRERLKLCEGQGSQVFGGFRFGIRS